MQGWCKWLVLEKSCIFIVVKKHHLFCSSQAQPVDYRSHPLVQHPLRKPAERLWSWTVSLLLLRRILGLWTLSGACSPLTTRKKRKWWVSHKNHIKVCERECLSRGKHIWCLIIQKPLGGLGLTLSLVPHCRFSCHKFLFSEKTSSQN